MERKNDIFIFVGPPGCGKGTLANVCVQELGWLQLSTGNLCRKHIADGTEIGKKIDFLIKSGKLIPDDLMSAMVEGWLLQHVMENSAIVLDGYPRTQPQAQILQHMVSERLSSYQLRVIRFTIAPHILMERVNARVVCSNKDCQAVYSLSNESCMSKDKVACDRCSAVLIRRADDNRSVVEQRLSLYQEHERNMLDFYKQIKQPIVEIESEKQIVDVFNDFRRLIGLQNQ